MKAIALCSNPQLNHGATQVDTKYCKINWRAREAAAVPELLVEGPAPAGPSTNNSGTLAASRALPINHAIFCVNPVCACIHTLLVKIMIGDNAPGCSSNNAKHAVLDCLHGEDTFPKKHDPVFGMVLKGTNRNQQDPIQLNIATFIFRLFLTIIRGLSTPLLA